MIAGVIAEAKANPALAAIFCTEIHTAIQVYTINDSDSLEILRPSVERLTVGMQIPLFITTLRM